MVLLRRRRQRQRMVAVTTQGGVPPNSHKPTFGGPWGPTTAPSNQLRTSPYDNQEQNYNSYQSPSNSDYPNQSPLPPPPAYGQGANNHGKYPAVRTFPLASGRLWFYKWISPLDLPHMLKFRIAIKPIQRWACL